MELKYWSLVTFNEWTELVFEVEDFKDPWNIYKQCKDTDSFSLLNIYSLANFE